MKTKSKPILITLLMIFLMVLVFLGYQSNLRIESIKKPSDLSLDAEMSIIINSKDQKERHDHLITLLEKVGPLKTQELMVKSGIPLSGKNHALMHTIGDYLYEKYKDKALFYCEDYFLEACYHGVVINQIADSGINGVSKMVAKCQSEIKIGQCAHAVGHGLMAFENYDLPKALELCEKIKVEGYNLSNSCYDGAFMENVRGGHRSTSETITQNPWLSETDIFYPCNKVGEKYKVNCWNWQATRILQMNGGDIDKVTNICRKLSENLKSSCFNNLGREISLAAREDLNKRLDFCKNFGKDENYCLAVNSSHAFISGYYNLSFLLCQEISDSNQKNACLKSILSRLESLKASSGIEDICPKFENDSFKQECQEKTDT